MTEFAYLRRCVQPAVGIPKLQHKKGTPRSKKTSGIAPEGPCCQEAEEPAIDKQIANPNRPAIAHRHYVVCSLQLEALRHEGKGTAQVDSLR